MNKLIILCMDGLEADYAAKLNLHMPHETTLTIPDELYENGTPHTLHIWPSMFTGKPTRHPELDTTRVTIRHFLNNHGIRWSRSGDKISLNKPLDDRDIKGRLYRAAVVLEETVFGEYESYIHDIPGVTDGFVLGGNKNWAKRKHLLFNILAQTIPRHNYRLVALYTHSPDYDAHRKQPIDNIYKTGYLHAQTIAKKHDVMLLSDHGCVWGGAHTDHAYIGANFPFKAESVLDVRGVIEGQLNGGPQAVIEATLRTKEIEK